MLPVHSSASLYPHLSSASFHLGPDYMKQSEVNITINTPDLSIHEKSRKLKVVELVGIKSIFAFSIKEKRAHMQHSDE
jgi:hypothetical protein